MNPNNKYQLYKLQRRHQGSSDQFQDVVPQVYSVDGDGTMQVIDLGVSDECGYYPNYVFQFADGTTATTATVPSSNEDAYISGVRSWLDDYSIQCMPISHPYWCVSVGSTRGVGRLGLTTLHIGCSPNSGDTRNGTVIYRQSGSSKEIKVDISQETTTDLFGFSFESGQDVTSKTIEASNVASSQTINIYSTFNEVGGAPFEVYHIEGGDWLTCDVNPYYQNVVVNYLQNATASQRTGTIVLHQLRTNKIMYLNVVQNA